MVDEKKPFWATLPGILTGIAAVLTAGGTLLTLFLTGGDGKGTAQVTPASFAAEANAACASTNDQIRSLPVPTDPESQVERLAEAIRIVTSGNQQIQALARPSDPAVNAKIDRVLFLASQNVLNSQNAVDAFRAGDQVRAQAFDATAQSLLPELQRLDSELGANVCALGVR